MLLIIYNKYNLRPAFSLNDWNFLYIGKIEAEWDTGVRREGKFSRKLCRFWDYFFHYIIHFLHFLKIAILFFLPISKKINLKIQIIYVKTYCSILPRCPIPPRSTLQRYALRIEPPFPVINNWCTMMYEEFPKLRFFKL